MGIQIRLVQHPKTGGSQRKLFFIDNNHVQCTWTWNKYLKNMLLLYFIFFLLQTGANR